MNMYEDELPIHEIPRSEKQHGASVPYLTACHTAAARRAENQQRLQQLAAHPPSGFFCDLPPRAATAEPSTRARLKAYRSAQTPHVK